MRKKARLGNDPFNFIKDSRSEAQLEVKETNKRQDMPKTDNTKLDIITSGQNFSNQPNQISSGGYSNKVSALTNPDNIELIQSTTDRADQEFKNLSALMQEKDNDLSDLREKLAEEKQFRLREAKKFEQDKEQLKIHYQANYKHLKALLQSTEKELVELKEAFSNEQSNWEKQSEIYLRRVERLSSFLSFSSKEMNKFRNAKREQEVKADQIREEKKGLKEELENSKAKITKYEKEIDGIKSLISTKNSELDQKKAILQEHDKKLEKLKKERDKLASELQNSESRESTLKAEINNFKSQLTLKDSEIEEFKKEVRQLSSWLDELNYVMKVFLESKRWKMGNTLGNINNKILFRAEVPMPEGRLNKIFSRYAKWKKK